jgi:hypothetical protein
VQSLPPARRQPQGVSPAAHARATPHAGVPQAEFGVTHRPAVITNGESARTLTKTRLANDGAIVVELEFVTENSSLSERFASEVCIYLARSSDPSKHPYGFRLASEKRMESGSFWLDLLRKTYRIFSNGSFVRSLPRSVDGSKTRA